MSNYYAECPVCGAVQTDYARREPECEHYRFSDDHNGYLAHVNCAGCGENKPFSIRTSDANGGEFYCSMECLRRTA